LYKSSISNKQATKLTKNADNGERVGNRGRKRSFNDILLNWQTIINYGDLKEWVIKTHKYTLPLKSKIVNYS
jgi:hypothetical protein